LELRRKYLVAVVLLAVLAVVFGFAGTVAPLPVRVSPQQSSSSPDSLTHFVNPPTFDSGWVNITDMAGEHFSITHNLNNTNIVVDITGKMILDSGVHQNRLGGTRYTQGWRKDYGGVDGDGAGSIVQTSDGGYAIAGYTKSYGAGYQDFWLVKTDPDGDVLWNQTYGGTGDEGASSVVQTFDGGYAIAGSTNSSGAGGYDAWLVTTDKNGNVLWNQTYGGISNDLVRSVVQTGDGGYALAGYTQSFGAGGYDFWLVRADSEGNVLWNQTYGGGSNDIVRSMTQTSDGGYAIAGYTLSFGAGYQDFWLVKTDSTGTVQWNQTYGGTDPDFAYSIVQTSEGGYTMVGLTCSYGAGYSDFWLVTTDSTGNALWNRTYGAASNDEAYSGIQTTDRGYAIAGITYSIHFALEYSWLIKTDPDGNVLWSRMYEGANIGLPYSMIQTSDGGYTLAGYTASNEPSNEDLWLVRTDTEFGLAWTDSTDNAITLYRGRTDAHWNYVRVRIWVVEEPTWQFGDINQDGAVDAQDLLILSQHYGQPLSLLSLGGIVGILGVQTYKGRKRQE